MTLIYLVAMAALDLPPRIYGVWSSAQTLGLTNNSRARRQRPRCWRHRRRGDRRRAVPDFVLAGVID